jgi:hypothetical protein
MLIDIKIKSDSGTDGDLDEVMDSEVVSLSLNHTGSVVGLAPFPSSTSSFQQATMVPPDNHTLNKAFIIDRFDNHGGNGGFDKHQLDIFYCKRCGMVEADAVVIPNSGYLIARTFFGVGAAGRIDLKTEKSALGVTVSGYTTAAGPSPTYSETVTIRP